MNDKKKEAEKTDIELKLPLEVANEALKTLLELKKFKKHEVKDRSAKQRSKIYNKTQKKQGTDYIFDDVELMFVDKNKNQILFYHLMDTPFVPGFGKGNCERPLEFGTEKWKRQPHNCGGYSKEITNNNL